MALSFVATLGVYAFNDEPFGIKFAYAFLAFNLYYDIALYYYYLQFHQDKA